jgi:hypothetical protein
MCAPRHLVHLCFSEFELFGICCMSLLLLIYKSYRSKKIFHGRMCFARSSRPAWEKKQAQSTQVYEPSSIPHPKIAASISLAARNRVGSLRSSLLYLLIAASPRRRQRPLVPTLPFGRMRRQTPHMELRPPQATDSCWLLASIFLHHPRRQAHHSHMVYHRLQAMIPPPLPTALIRAVVRPLHMMVNARGCDRVMGRDLGWDFLWLLRGIPDARIWWNCFLRFYRGGRFRDQVPDASNCT